MFELSTIFFYCCAVFVAPAVLQSRPLRQHAEADVTSFFIRGENTGEKSTAVIIMRPAMSAKLSGNGNLVERIQIASGVLPGIKNLAEKSMPDAAISGAVNDNPKSEYEHI
ncbi:uncharacterized protein [Fopius arisanus]|uniref:Uncharacterized protein n=1 Tax=Fopius arisanus TaxID=64838 RepID=A0A9R1UB68_9HYME|nr:PREDICTED: uncharacterized protein LOC105273978 [Fopius arisanus]